MADPRFYVRAGPFSLGELARLAKASLAPGADPEFRVVDAGAIEAVESGEIAYAAKPREAQRAASKNSIALIVPPDIARTDLTAECLLCEEPQRAFAVILAHLYPPDRQPTFPPQGTAIDPSAKIAGSCMLAERVVIGAHVEIGEDTRIGPNAAIGPGVKIGRWCRIGAGVSISHALIGDRVIIAPNCAIGQDGFGYVIGPKGHLKFPQLGRVILQDDVELGALTAIDRGGLGDTVIGQGTKIDNLVHIAHNCRIGRHCMIAGQCGFGGSVEIGDFVVMGGQVAIRDHMTIGSGAILAGRTGVTDHVPAGETYAGFPGRPVAHWRREVALLARMVKNRRRPD
jgi:UDP-3-O-[3-hydroxymyristoyl] glucosamine N-acyltransferase